MSGDDNYDDEQYEENEQVELEPCDICGRRFRPDVLSKHRRACQKLQKKGRKTFDSSKQRAVVTGDVVIPVAKLATHSETAKKPENPFGSKKKSNWRQKSEEFRAVMRATRTDKNGDPGPPVPAFTRDDLVECQYCGRKFGENAAERHIKFCEQQHQRRGGNLDEAARDRMNIRTKYQPPKLKSKSTLQEDDRLLRRPQQGGRVGSEAPNARMKTMVHGDDEQPNSAPVGNNRNRRPQFDPRTYDDSANGVGHIPLQVSSYGGDSAYSTMQVGKPPMGNARGARRAPNGATGIPKPAFGLNGSGSGSSQHSTPNRNGVRSRTPSPAPRGRNANGNDSAAKRDFVASKILARVNVKHRTADDSDGEEPALLHESARRNAPQRGKANGYSNGNGVKKEAADGRSLPKFCHECGFTFPIAQAKFCCECGARRIVIGPSSSD